jgi:hypothetical protein
MKTLLSLWNEIRQGENIDSYIAIVVAIALSIANIFGIASQSLLASITLAVLALLAITNLGNRHRLESALNKNNNDFFIKKFPETLVDDMIKAKELWLSGYNLTRTIVTHMKLIEEKVERGEKVKILLLDPKAAALTYANRTLHYTVADEQHRQWIENTLNNLHLIAKSNKSNIEVRLIDFPLSFSIKAMDIMTPSGKIYVKMYEYRVKTEGPRIFLTTKDERWYEYYRDQILALWDDAKPVEW